MARYVYARHPAGDGDEPVTASAWLKSSRLRVEDFLAPREGEASADAEPFLFPDDLDAKLAFDVAKLTYYGLYALQHRGQESAGITVADGHRLTTHKMMGLVADVFDEETLAAIETRTRKAGGEVVGLRERRPGQQDGVSTGVLFALLGATRRSVVRIGHLLDHVQAVTPALHEVAFACDHLPLGLPRLLRESVLLAADPAQPRDHRQTDRLVAGP